VIESVRHLLAFAVRVDDHFREAPVTEELAVELDTLEPATRNAQRTGFRHEDGTYRFLDLAAGPRQVRVTSPSGCGFTWTATTAVGVPVADPRQPVVVELWPTPRAAAPPGVIAIRGVLMTAPTGQEVRIEPVASSPRNKRTRCDDRGEFLFVVAGWTELDPATGRVELSVAVPTRTVTSVDVDDGGLVTSFPGSTFSVPPGRETRARIHLL